MNKYYKNHKIIIKIMGFEPADKMEHINSAKITPNNLFFPFSF
jgi:hypothetical protein